MSDLLYLLFTALGMEPRAVMVSADFVNGVQYAAPVSGPLSHGLLMSLVWAIVAASVMEFFHGGRWTGVTVGGVVFSHWVLDFLMLANLPLLFDGSHLVGLGLENTGPGFLFITILDVVILAAGILAYVRSRQRRSPSAARERTRT